MQAFREFVSKFPTKKFDKGELIIIGGEAPQSAYVVKRGIVKSYSITSDGLERPISFDSEMDIFPLGWVFNLLPWAQYYYGAFTDCEIYIVPREEYIEYLKTRKESLYDVFANFVVAHLNLQMRVNALEQPKAIDKIIHTLHYLSIRHGRELAPNTVRIGLPLTQQDLANIMGLTRETTGIELKKLEKKGVVTYRRQNYIVHTAELNAILDEEYDQARIKK